MWLPGCCVPSVSFGPVPAIRMALERAKLSLDDMDLVEVNEAFGAQCVDYICSHVLGRLAQASTLSSTRMRVIVPGSSRARRSSA